VDACARAWVATSRHALHQPLWGLRERTTRTTSHTATPFDHTASDTFNQTTRLPSGPSDALRATAENSRNAFGGSTDSTTHAFHHTTSDAGNRATQRTRRTTNGARHGARRTTNGAADCTGSRGDASSDGRRSRTDCTQDS
jgi:predicted mannosyl-3-phosphoglycerate phosphatase (HAD superfamily)